MMDCVLSGSLLVVFSLFCYAMCVFFRANKLSLTGKSGAASLLLWARRAEGDCCSSGVWQASAGSATLSAYVGS